MSSCFIATWERRTSAHTVVLIHGDFSDGAGTWGRQMTSEALLSRCRLIVVDRRGAGQSPVEPRPYTIRSEALDVLALLDALEIEGCHIAGHSYGGLIAIELTTLAESASQACTSSSRLSWRSCPMTRTFASCGNLPVRSRIGRPNSRPMR